MPFQYLRRLLNNLGLKQNANNSVVFLEPIEDFLRIHFKQLASPNELVALQAMEQIQARTIEWVSLFIDLFVLGDISKALVYRNIFYDRIWASRLNAREVDNPVKWLSDRLWDAAVKHHSGIVSFQLQDGSIATMPDYERFIRAVRQIATTIDSPVRDLYLYLIDHKMDVRTFAAMHKLPTEDVDQLLFEFKAVIYQRVFAEVPTHHHPQIC